MDITPTPQEKIKKVNEIKGKLCKSVTNVWVLDIENVKKNQFGNKMNTHI